MTPEEDVIQFVKGSVQPMAEWTFPFISSIVGIDSADEGTHIGSAFRLAVGAQKALVTANHVFEAARASRFGVGYTARRGEPPARLPNAPDFADPISDLVVFFLTDAEARTSEDGAFWPVERCDGNPVAREHDYLFLHGFPGERARFLFGSLYRRSLPYGVMQRDDDLPENLETFQFAMDYDPNNMRLPGGKEASLVLPVGLSGSPVWRIGAYRQDPRSWKPADAALVGVVTHWNAEKRVLLATSITQLQRLVEQPRR